MTYETALELTGYFASILILVSLLMSSAVKLRIINAIGAAVFTVYGILIHSYPTAFLNAVSVIVDIYYLVKLLRGKVRYVSYPVSREESALNEFLRFYRDDIGHFFPSFDFQLHAADQIILVYAEAAPVGLFICQKEGSGSLRIRLDYSIPKFRDCSVGRYLYEELRSEGIRELIIDEFTQDHESYLKKAGFTARGSEYVKKLN